MFFKRRKPQRSGKPEWDGESFDLDDPRLPPPIRETAISLAAGESGWCLFFSETNDGGEWYLFDNDAELVEVLWLEA